MTRVQVILGTLGLLCSLSGFQACQKPASSHSTSTCQVASDQYGSFMPFPLELPIQVVVDTTFTKSQREGIEQGIAEWNSFGQRTVKKDLFKIYLKSISDHLKEVDPRDCKLNMNAAGTLSLIREKSLQSWKKLGFDSQIPGATIRCSSSGILDQQMIFIFAELVEPVQLTSVILHELGHSLGLDHSCTEKTGRSDFRACTGLEPSHPYQIAVMYPWLRTRAMGSNRSEEVEIKESLRPNDEQRAQCVVEGK